MNNIKNHIGHFGSKTENYEVTKVSEGLVAVAAITEEGENKIKVVKAEIDMFAYGVETQIVEDIYGRKVILVSAKKNW